MGRALGVLHAAGNVDEPLSAEQVAKLTTLGIQAGGRIGTVRAFARTQIQATTNGLTGLANRRTLEGQVRTLFGSGERFAVVLADLDRFKHLNDTLGHQAGNIALKQYAEVARSMLGPADLAAGWGGEELVFVLPGASATSALAWVERLRAQLAEAQLVNGHTVFTARYGIADTAMASTLDDLMTIADAALYRSTDDGRDRGTIGEALGAAPNVQRHATEHHARVDLQQLVDQSH